MNNQTPMFQTVELDEPIQRGEQTISIITLRRPNAGELRGLSMMEVLQMKTDALFALLPRISEPMLLPNELHQMNPADFVQISTHVAQLFMSKKIKDEAGMMTPS